VTCNSFGHRNNNPDGFGAVPLSIPLGKGVALPGLEEGIVGMRKGEIRRIIVPSELGYSKYPGLEPIPMNNLGTRLGFVTAI
jgi:FKBP-type peptidyl-prolyl cis-trans isomerase 2